MKKLLLLAFLVLAQLCAAQFTTVSGTVTDPNGLPYANGTIAPILVVSGGSAVFTSTKLLYTPPTQPVGLNSSGSFVMQLADNTQLTPVGSQWNFIITCGSGCVPAAFGSGQITFTLASPITISGSSQSITANLTAVAPALTATFGGGGGNVSGTLTAGIVPTSTAAHTLANSLIQMVSGGGSVNLGYSGNPLTGVPSILELMQPSSVSCSGTNTIPAPTIGCAGEYNQFSPSNSGSTLGSSAALRLFNASGTANSQTLQLGLYDLVNAYAQTTTEERAAEFDAYDTLSVVTGTRRGILAFAGNATGNTSTTNEAIVAKTYVSGSGTTNTNDYTVHILAPTIQSGGAMTNHVGLQIDTQGSGSALVTGTDPVSVGGVLTVSSGLTLPFLIPCYPTYVHQGNQIASPAVTCDTTAYGDATESLRIAHAAYDVAVLQGGIVDARGEGVSGTGGWGSTPINVGNLQYPTVTLNGTGGSFGNTTAMIFIAEGTLPTASRGWADTPNTCGSSTCSYTVTAPTLYGGASNYSIYEGPNRASLALCASGLTANYTITGPCGGAAWGGLQPKVTLELPPNGNVTASGLTDGFSAYFNQDPGSEIHSPGSQSAWFRMTVTSGTPAAIYMSDLVLAAPGSGATAVGTVNAPYAHLNGLFLQNQGATSSNADCFFGASDDESLYENFSCNLQTGSGTVQEMFVADGCCSTEFRHFSVGGGGFNSGTPPLKVGGPLAVNNTHFDDVTVNTPGTNTSNIFVTGITTTNVTFDHVYGEDHNTGGNCGGYGMSVNGSVGGVSLTNFDFTCSTANAGNTKGGVTIGSGANFFGNFGQINTANSGTTAVLYNDQSQTPTNNVYSAPNTPTPIPYWSNAWFNCAVGGASGTTTPLACGNATKGIVAWQASAGASLVINTTAIGVSSKVLLQSLTDNTSIPSTPTCSSTFATYYVSTRTAGTSFTITSSNPATIQCLQWEIIP